MASDPEEQIAAESVAPGARSWADRLRPSRVRLLAPLLSVAILIGLIARASDCDHEPGAYPRTDLEWPRPVRVTQDARGTKSTGVRPPLAQPAQPSAGVLRSSGTLGGTKAPALGGLGLQRSTDDPPSDLDALNSLGGSKSGFGGLGLRGHGRGPGTSHAPAQHEAP